MDDIFIIGLPKDLRSRIEAHAKRNDARVKTILAGNVAPLGHLELLPYSAQSIYDLRAFMDERNNWSDIQILVLPYAPIPDNLAEELQAIKELVGTFHSPLAGLCEWPHLPKHSPNKQFVDSLLPLIKGLLFPVSNELPSVFFAELAAECGQILIPDGAIDACDQVAPHRYIFLIEAGHAIREFLKLRGDVGRVSEFFAGRGLGHAQSGGIQAELEVFRGGKNLYSAKIQTHLKKGDKTTARAAVRLYYDFFQIGGALHAAILYAGPHPDTNVKRWIYLE